MTDINSAVGDVEQFLASYAGPGGIKPAELTVRPSGDETDVIKVWVDLGPAGVAADTAAWATACEAAIRAAVPSVGPFRFEIRVEAG